MQKGDIVNRWYDSGAFGAQMIFGEVVRVNRKTVTVRWEGNRIWRIVPQEIQPVTGLLANEVRAKYFTPPNTTYTGLGLSAAKSADTEPEVSPVAATGSQPSR